MRYWIPALALLCTACIPDIYGTGPEVAGIQIGGDPRILQEPADGVEAEIRMDKQVEIRLISNPTTGYMWQILDPQPVGLRLVDERYDADPAPEGLTGSGGVQVFLFQGDRPGAYEFTLSYQRSPADVAETRTINIEVY
ncbi:MAG: protease inhibitor I42 family protein [Pseudomonadota bacterium]